MLVLIKDELTKGINKFDISWGLFGLILQIIGIIVGFKSENPDNIFTIIAGISGIIAIIYATKGKICNFFFSFINIFCYILGFTIPNKLYGETIKYIYYAFVNIISIYFWSKSYNFDKKSIEVKHLNFIKNFVLCIFIVFGVFIYGLFLSKTSDSDPYFDSLTSIIAYTAQILSIFGYSDQWVYWFILDIFSVVLAWRANSMVIIAKFIFYTLNCLKGWIEWRKTTKN